MTTPCAAEQCRRFDRSTTSLTNCIRSVKVTLHLKVRLLHYVAALTVQTIPDILVLIPHHSSLSVLEMFSDSSSESEKITIEVKLNKTLQVETHLSEKADVFVGLRNKTISGRRFIKPFTILQLFLLDLRHKTMGVHKTEKHCYNPNIPKQSNQGHLQMCLSDYEIRLSVGAVSSDPSLFFSFSSWTYGIKLWRCTKPRNIAIIQIFQNKVLRAIFNAPWYVRNADLHRDLKM